MGCKCSECMMHVDWAEGADGPTEWVPAKLLADRDAEIERLRVELAAFEKVGRAAGKIMNDGLQKEAEQRAEIERLRADLVWAVEHAELTSKGTSYAELWLVLDGVRSIKTDGTPDSICRAVRAVREARDGE